MNANKVLVMVGIVAGLCLGAGVVKAQDNNAGGQTNSSGRGRGNWDPAQMQKRMMDGIRERLGFTNDVEWTAVQPLIQKVMDARSETRGGGFGFGRSGRPPGGGSSSLFKTLPEADALQKAIEDKAPAEQVKNAMEKYRAAKKVSEAKLAAAQADLQKVLTQRQEAMAVLAGYLP